MKNIKRLTLVLVCIVLFTTCKKYPEGGYINKGDNYIEGTWTLTLYEVNGIDSTELINFGGNEAYKRCIFSKHHSKDDDFSGGSDGLNCIGAIKNGNKDLLFSYGIFSSQVCYVGYYCVKAYLSPEGGNTAWQIQKLTKNELVITCNLKNNYKIFMKK